MDITQKIFSIFFNSIFSFWSGLFVIYISIKLFRIDTSRWKLLILSLPFIKILWDLFQGTAQTSFWNHGVDPFALPPKHHYLTAGTGFSEYGPVLNIVLSLKDTNGNNYSVSVAEYLGYWISKNYGDWTLSTLLIFIFSISLFLLLKRVWSYSSFEIKRRRDRESGKVEVLTEERIRGKAVDVYVSEGYRGTPFTGGLLRSFICVPKETHKKLSDDELRAVIKHEVAHIKHFDLYITLAIKILGDLFWFVPGYILLSKKIDRLREILADKSAVEDGANPRVLSSVLIKLKEIQIDLRHNVLYSALFREKSLIRERVLELTNNNLRVRPRFGWSNKYARFLIVAWTCGGVMIATLGGNHEYERTPEWIENIAKYFGWI